jgi:hypothetical protein
MTLLILPPQVADAFGALGRMSEAAFAGLQGALRDVDEPLSRHGLIHRLSGALPVSEAEALVSALADAVAARPETRATIGELVARSLDLSGEGADDLKKRIAARVDLLLDTKSAAILTIKRDSTVNDRPLLLEKARIETDIRPVFGDAGETDEVGGQLGVTVIHTLRLDVFEDWRPRSFYVALPEDGLDMLEAVLERARRKEAILSETLAKGGLRLLPVDPV